MVRRGAIGRKRRLTGWTLLTLGVLVAGVWVASMFWVVHYYCRAPNQEVRVLQGWVHCWRTSPQTLPSESGKWEWIATDGARPEWWLEWRTERRSAADSLSLGVLRWSKAVYATSTTLWSVDVLFWPIPLLLWTPAALLLRSGILARRRAITGKCSKCGYSLVGLGAGAACPECGKAGTVTA